MSYRQLFYLGPRLLGESSREDQWVHNSLEPPRSLALFCERCGDVWGRVVVPGAPFRVYSISCEKHDPGWRYSVAGSFWLIWDRDHNASLPAAVLNRELDLCFRHFDKHQEEFAL